MKKELVIIAWKRKDSNSMEGTEKARINLDEYDRITIDIQKKKAEPEDLHGGKLITRKEHEKIHKGQKNELMV